MKSNISRTFDDLAKETVLRHITQGNQKTTDPWHTYTDKDGEIVYQWGIITNHDDLLIIFEMTDKKEFDRNHKLANQFIRENGGRQ